MTRKQIALLLLCLVLTLGVVSCGDEEEPTPTPAPPTTAPTNTPPPPPTDTPAPTDTPVPTNTSEAVEAAAAPDQPESPLSPLPTPAAEVQQTGASATDAVEQLVNELKPPQPQSGKGSISGLLYSYAQSRVIPGTQFYLTKGLEDNGIVIPPAVFLGPKEEQGDVVGFSNDNGQLFLDNIPPGNYYLAVWTVYDWLLAFDKQEDKSPLLITVKEGDQLNLGKLELNWP